MGPGQLLPRHVERVIREALTDTRVVLVNGARQAGKSTLVRKIGSDLGASWHTLDHPATLQAARFDPTEFVASDVLMIIDEVQREPELLLAMKVRVDTDPRPGQYLLTGSARVLGLRDLPDTLVGRMETVELWPLSQGEIGGQPDAFIDAAFVQGPELDVMTAEDRRGYVDRVVRGGFPEATVRAPRRRSRFLQSYVADLISRDVTELSEIQRGSELRALTRMLAGRSGQLLVPGRLARDLGLAQTTVERYLGLLEQVFLIKRIPPWSRNLSTRATATPKVIMVDSGLAAELLGFDAGSLRRPTAPLGGLLEGFVLGEIARQLTWSEQSAEMYHYRTKDNVEVDLVLENRRGEVVAIEVKASSTVRAEDFAGLRHLEARLGDDLLVGIVLYTGQQTLPFGPKMRAMPIAAIWEAGPSPMPA
jgi:predicted AAA+ superfamily ATPase